MGTYGRTYIYYGNDGVSTTSSGVDTFLFFDDFEDNSLDAWDTVSTTGVSVQSTTKKYGTYAMKQYSTTETPWARFESLASLTHDVMIHAWAMAPNAWTGPAVIARADSGSLLDWRIRTDDIQYYRVTGGYADYTANENAADNVWYRAETGLSFSEDESKNYKDRLYLGDGATSLLTTGDAAFTNLDGVQLSNQQNYFSYYDDAYIRRWLYAGEPYMSSVNAEEQKVAPINISVDVLDLDLTDNIFAGRIYTLFVNVSDADGYADINYVLVNFTDSQLVDDRCGVRYFQGNDSFDAYYHGGEIAIEAGSNSSSSSGDYLVLYIKFSISFYYSSTTNRLDEDLSIITVDDFGLSDEDWSDDNIDVVVEMYIWGGGQDDDIGTQNRGPLDGPVRLRLALHYNDSFDDDSDPEIEVHADILDVWAICENVTGSPFKGGMISVNPTIAGYYDMMEVTGYGDDVVGIDIWTFKIVPNNAGYGGQAIKSNSEDFTLSYISDTVTITVSATSTWLMINQYSNVTYVATYDYDSTVFDGSISWTNTPSYQTSSTAVTKTFYPVTISGDTHGIITFTDNQLSVIWDTIVSTGSISKYWVQYSATEVSLIWGTGSVWKWSVNDTFVPDGIVFTAYSNGTGPSAASGIYGSGNLGSLAIGFYNPSWYFVNLQVNATYDGFDLIVYQDTLAVDVLHSIHIEDSVFYLTDNWVTVGFQTNWNNATFFIWDNITGTPVFVGSSYEGLYQFAKSGTVGLHKLIILVNGTHGTLDESSQVAGTVDTDSWEYLEVQYTVNPVTFSIMELSIQQNNDTIIISGWFLTPNTTLTWVLIEDGVQTGTGTLQLTASGEYNSIRWTKVDYETAGNFTLTITADGSSVVIHGYRFIIYDVSYSTGGFYQEGDTYYMVAPDSDDMAWVVALAIVGIIMIPVAIGLGFGINETRKRRRPKRDKSNDGLYRT